MSIHEIQTFAPEGIVLAIIDNHILDPTMKYIHLKFPMNV